MSAVGGPGGGGGAKIFNFPGTGRVSTASTNAAALVSPRTRAWQIFEQHPNTGRVSYTANTAQDSAMHLAIHRLPLPVFQEFKALFPRLPGSAATGIDAAHLVPGLSADDYIAMQVAKRGGGEYRLVLPDSDSALRALLGGSTYFQLEEHLPTGMLVGASDELSAALDETRAVGRATVHYVDGEGNELGYRLFAGPSGVLLGHSAVFTSGPVTVGWENGIMQRYDLKMGVLELHDAEWMQLPGLQPMMLPRDGIASGWVQLSTKANIYKYWPESPMSLQPEYYSYDRGNVRFHNLDAGIEFTTVALRGGGMYQLSLTRVDTDVDFAWEEGDRRYVKRVMASDFAAGRVETFIIPHGVIMSDANKVDIRFDPPQRSVASSGFRVV